MKLKIQYFYSNNGEVFLAWNLHVFLKEYQHINSMLCLKETRRISPPRHRGVFSQRVSLRPQPLSCLCYPEHYMASPVAAPPYLFEFWTDSGVTLAEICWNLKWIDSDIEQQRTPSTSACPGGTWFKIQCGQAGRGNPEVIEGQRVFMLCFVIR